MTNWLRRGLERLNILAAPARHEAPDFVIEQTLRDLRDYVPELNYQCARYMTNALLLYRQISHELSTTGAGVEEFFDTRLSQSHNWKILFIQQEVILLVRGTYVTQKGDLENRYLPLIRQYRQYADANLRRSLMAKFEEELKGTMWGAEPIAAATIQRLALLTHEAVDNNDSQKIRDSLSKLPIPQKEVQEVLGLFERSPAELYQIEAEREAQKKAAAEHAEREGAPAGGPSGEASLTRPGGSSLPGDEKASGGVSEAEMPAAGGGTSAGVGDTPAGGPVRDLVFISYSRKDARWLELLKEHLKPLERAGLIKRWDDTEIKPSQVWGDEIKGAIKSARVIILLMSPAFLASDYIAKEELPPLLKAAETEGASVLSLVIHPGNYAQAENILRYQTVNPPNKPLSQMSDTKCLPN